MRTTSARGRERRHDPHREAARSLITVSRHLWLGCPALLMLAGVVGLSLYLRRLLGAAAAGQSLAAGAVGFWLVVVTFIATSVLVLAVQCMRMAERIAGPEHRLRGALQRIRSGDVGFRITLRRGDPLQELAYECNELLDWLNQNPPAGARTGGDVVDVEADVEVDVALPADALEEVAP